MDAKEFIRTHKRICKKHGDACKNCPLLDKGCYSTSTSIILPEELDESVVDLVEKWAKENPVKTRQSKILEQFPNARLTEYGAISVCPRVLFGNNVISDSSCRSISCKSCEDNFWLEEVD